MPRPDLSGVRWCGFVRSGPHLAGRTQMAPGDSAPLLARFLFVGLGGVPDAELTAILEGSLGTGG
jgi:hypothetical protein